MTFLLLLSQKLLEPAWLFSPTNRKNLTNLVPLELTCSEATLSLTTLKFLIQELIQTHSLVPRRKCLWTLGSNSNRPVMLIYILWLMGLATKQTNHLPSTRVSFTWRQSPTSLKPTGSWCKEMRFISTGSKTSKNINLCTVSQAHTSRVFLTKWWRRGLIIYLDANTTQSRLWSHQTNLEWFTLPANRKSKLGLNAFKTLWATPTYLTFTNLTKLWARDSLVWSSLDSIWKLVRKLQWSRLRKRTWRTSKCFSRGEKLRCSRCASTRILFP